MRPQNSIQLEILDYFSDFSEKHFLLCAAFWDARKALIPMVGAVREAGTSGDARIHANEHTWKSSVGPTCAFVLAKRGAT